MRLFATLVLGLMQAVPVPAAEIALRPDLAPRLEALRPVYPSSEPVLDDRGLWDSANWHEGIIHVSGPIVEGDLDRLKALTGSPGDPALPRPIHVVFDSPGGSLTEGVAIGRYLQEWRGGNFASGLGGVFVLKRNRCLSACALAFALSSLPRDKGGQERFVEVGADLGFHMPFLRAEDATQLAEAGKVMELAFDSMSVFLSLISNGQTPPALAQNVVHYRGADEMFVLRGGLVTRVLGFDPVATGALVAPVTRDGLTEDDILFVCGLLDQTREGGLPDRTAYEFWLLDEAADCRELGGYEAALTDGGDADVTAGALADVLGCHGGQLTTAYFGWDWDNEFLEEETGAVNRARSGGAGQDAPPRIDWSREALATVNLRDRAGLGGAPLGRLEKGTPVTVTDCAVTDDPQGVWFEVTGEGQEGWVSARYISRRERAPNLLDLIRPVGFE